MVFARHLTHTVWQRQGFWGELGWLALTPFSLGFSALVRSRNLLYDRRWLPVKYTALKVISVGNLTVGGTGKTPLVLWLAHALQQRGRQVGILSRGYGGNNTQVTVVGTTGHALATPAEVGDEPVMLARSFAGVVIAGRDRVAAAEVARERFGLDVVILDDGFQHRRLARDVNLLLVNGRNGTGNGWLLPAGPLREPAAAARRADIVIVTKGEPHERHGWPVGGETRPVFTGDLFPTALVSSAQGEWRELPLGLLYGKRVVALTGIADPEPFYWSLREWEAQVAEVIEFPDHHVYTQADWQAISLASQKFDLIVTTEKDLVKLERFPFATGKLVALQVRMEITDGDQLLGLIERQLAWNGMSQ
jgi:tetraacyldisaccharide 4'-kinase